ncbi:MAG: hypothetical protein QM704_25235 [Anaeromyxobacteraceae bacterium]
MRIHPRVPGAAAAEQAGRHDRDPGDDGGEDERAGRVRDEEREEDGGDEEVDARGGARPAGHVDDRERRDGHEEARVHDRLGQARGPREEPGRDEERARPRQPRDEDDPGVRRAPERLGGREDEQHAAAHERDPAADPRGLLDGQASVRHLAIML